MPTPAGDLFPAHSVPPPLFSAALQVRTSLMDSYITLHKKNALNFPVKCFFTVDCHSGQ